MPTIQVCPECDAKIQVRQAITRKARIKCPRCKVIFVPEVDEDPAEELEVQAIPQDQLQQLELIEVVSIRSSAPKEEEPAEALEDDEIVEGVPDLFQENEPPP